MNVAKNWALTIMLIALTFAHFSSRANCCWKSKWLSLLKKTFSNAGHIDAKLINSSEICQKKPQRNRLFFTDCFLAKFPPEISREIGRFSKWADFSANFDSSPVKIARNRPIVPRILIFFPAKIPRNRPIFLRICPWKSREILLFFPRNIRSPA